MTSIWQTLNHYWPHITAISTVVNLIITIVFIGWILSIKKEPMSALAWCLTVVLLPYFGAFLFLMLGYQHVHRPLKRKRRHKISFREFLDASHAGFSESDHSDHAWFEMAQLASRLDAFDPRGGNRIDFYWDGPPAYEAKLKAIEAAQHHIHLEYFIVQPDASVRQFVEALAHKARQGIEVRLLYDAMGSRRLTNRTLEPLTNAGGKCDAFLPLNPLRRRTQVNLRNHRKILIVDGKIAFTGGLNLGDEYLSKSRYFGYWRDTHLRLEGPAVADLQRVFAEDWDFAANERLHGPSYFPQVERTGESPVQIIQSGPDQELKSIREILFAAIMRARKRLWISTPYFVPDAGLLGALCLAARLGVDVRILGLSKPDKWLPYLAGRYYWGEALEAGVRVFQYKKGMMHAKMMLVDGSWATVGTANLDNRSLYLNFEVNCLLYDPALIVELETAFERDLAESKELLPEEFAKRSITLKVAENICRLASPML